MGTNQGIFAKHVQKAEEWINQINRLSGLDSSLLSLAALRSVLHQLRDNLVLEEAVHLSAQLPLVIKGIYFEDWRPHQTPLKERHTQGFVKSVLENLNHYENALFTMSDVEKIIKAIFQVTFSHIDKREADKLLKILPRGVKPFIEQINLVHLC